MDERGTAKRRNPADGPLKETGGAPEATDREHGAAHRRSEGQRATKADCDCEMEEQSVVNNATFEPSHCA